MRTGRSTPLRWGLRLPSVCWPNNTACRPFMGVWIEKTDTTPSWLTSPRRMVIKRIMCEKFLLFFSVLSPLTQGRGLKQTDNKKTTKESMTLYDSHLQTLYRENFLLFFLRVLSMYLSVLECHIPVFRAFLHFFVTVDCCKKVLLSAEHLSPRGGCSGRLLCVVR